MNYSEKTGVGYSMYNYAKYLLSQTSQEKKRKKKNRSSSSHNKVRPDNSAFSCILILLIFAHFSHAKMKGTQKYLSF